MGLRYSLNEYRVRKYKFEPAMPTCNIFKNADKGRRSVSGRGNKITKNTILTVWEGDRT